MYSITSIQDAFDDMARDGRVVYRRPGLPPTLLRSISVIPEGGCEFVITGMCGPELATERAVRIPIIKVMDLYAGHLIVQNIRWRVLQFEGYDPKRYQALWRRAGVR
jgi:hypothetical protein